MALFDWSILIGWTMLSNLDQHWSAWLINIDKHWVDFSIGAWVRLRINFDQHWLTFDQHWSSFDQHWLTFDQHWLTFNQHWLISNWAMELTVRQIIQDYCTWTTPAISSVTNKVIKTNEVYIPSRHHGTNSRDIMAPKVKEIESHNQLSSAQL